MKLLGYGAPAHSIIVSAFVGNEPRVYTIDLAFGPDHKSYHFRYTRHLVDFGESGQRTPRLAIGGSGALYLTRDNKWQRTLLRLVRAHDRGQVTSPAVADHLASINYAVHLGIADMSVGPRCIVAWRHRRGGTHNGGGAHQFYSGVARDSTSSCLPTISNGMDVQALIEAMWPHMARSLGATINGQSAAGLDQDLINADLARLPDKPDETLW